MKEQKITLEELIIECKDIECRIERLSEDSVATSTLFNKYNKITALNKIEFKKLLRKRKILNHELALYYTGKASEAVYKENPQPLKIMKSELEKFIDVNPKMVILDEEINIHEEKVIFLENIMKHFKDRTFAIKNAIDILKFQSGN